MIKNILKIIGGLLIVAVAYVGYMILFPVSPKGEANFKADDLSLHVEYHRPYKKGRLIFGEEKDGALFPMENIGEQALMQIQLLKQTKTYYLVIKNSLQENMAYLLFHMKIIGL